MLRGERIQAKLVEAITSSEWIVSHRGRLFQVKNHSQLTFVKGATIHLVVESAEPIRLRVVGELRLGTYSRRV